MAVEQITAYTFVPKTRKLTLTGLATVDPALLRSVRNKTRGTTYYLPGTDRKNILASGNVITLPDGYVGLGDSSTDELVIMYGEAPATPGSGTGPRLNSALDSLKNVTSKEWFA